MKSIREIFKIGKGPSSSHTIGPERAATLFKSRYPEADNYRVTLYESLCKTGKGHGTDRVLYEVLSPNPVEIIFCEETPTDVRHPNTMDFTAYCGNQICGTMRAISVGGGDIRIEGETESEGAEVYPENTFAEVGQFCRFRGLDLAEYVEFNEGEEIWDFLMDIWQTMKRSVQEGLQVEGFLPGELKIERTFALKDVLTCIDDFHPAGRQEETKLTASAQGIMRAYGDRSGRGRLRADASPMEARPPQGNAIITGEFPPDIGESGTARYFGLELHDGDVNLDELTFYQHRAAEGVLQRCMHGYLEWLKISALRDAETEERFTAFLKSEFEEKRSAFQKSGILCHGRIPEAVALLQIGMDMLLLYLELKGGLEKDVCDEVKQRFQNLVYQLAARQAESITQDKPTHKFIRKFYALLESGQVCVLNKNKPLDFVPQSCIGYEDEDFYYLHTDIVHKAVRKLCDEQGESFTISQKSLLKALAEEGVIETASGQNTKQVRVGGKKMRMLCLRKFMAKQIADAA